MTVDVIEVPAICSVVAFTSPLEPYITALLFTIVPADEPSTKFNSAPVDVTAVLSSAVVEHLFLKFHLHLHHLIYLIQWQLT